MNIKKIEIKVIRLTLLPMLLIAVLAFSSKDTAVKIYENNIFYSLNKARLEYTESIKNLNAARDADIGFVSISRSVQGPEVHLVILDESASRRHMSLYGYHRDTTPELDKMADDLLIFNDVISPNSHTFPVLKKAVTFLNTEDTTSAWEKGTLFQHLQKAGYHCYWLSAQGGQGRHNTFTLALSNFCNETYFIRDSHSTGDSGYDDDLSGWLEKILDDEHQKKFIFVHKMGKHMKYKLRFPQTSAVYSGDIQGKTGSQSEIINDYDNAVLYDSANIAKMLKYVKNLNVYSTVLYLSDHGEEVCENGDYFGHDQSRSRYMHEIPFVLWMSDSYKKNNKQKVSNIQQYLNRRYMTDDLPHSILDMLNIQAKHLELSRSIFSSNFISRPRIIGNNKDHNYDTIFGRSEISLSQMQEALASRQTHFKSRVWAHKVNSIEKLQQAANLYSGVELDVVYFPKKNVFDIHHPPEKSVGLTLDKYWGSNNYNDSLYYWIDFKNLTQDNSESALFRLSRLAEKFGISAEKILVESKNALALKKFRDKGFITSYYLPTGTLKELAGKQELNIAITGLPQAQKIQTLFQDSGVDGISTSARFYYLLDILFPKVEQVFLWDTSLEYYDEHDSEIIENTLIQSDRIKVLLTYFKPDYN